MPGVGAAQEQCRSSPRGARSSAGAAQEQQARAEHPEHQGRAPGQGRAPEPPINPSQAASVSPLFLGYFPGANIRHPDFCAKIRVFFGPAGADLFY